MKLLNAARRRLYVAEASVAERPGNIIRERGDWLLSDLN